MGTISSANAIFQISVETVIPIPVLLQGFSADDIYSVNPQESAETLMGVDGILSGGFVFVPVKQEISFQADSLSNLIFQQWYQAQVAAKDVFQCQAVVWLPSIGEKWSMNNGFMTTFHPMPDARKVLQPLRYAITWESISPAVI